MQNADYTKHMKNLGKLIYGYDQGYDPTNVLAVNLARTADQWATGNVEDQDYVNVYSARVNGMTSKLYSYPEGCLSEARAYLQTPAFKATLTNIPANDTVQAIIDAWVDDSVADSKTFTTKSTTGFINFMDQVYGSELSESTFPFPESGSPTYPDGTYCTNTVS
jgi:hypothetical protein